MFQLIPIRLSGHACEVNSGHSSVPIMQKQYSVLQHTENEGTLPKQACALNDSGVPLESVHKMPCIKHLSVRS